MEKKTFILIHGSWHGSWNWHKVVPLLESLGHNATALDLPGMVRDKTPIQEVKMGDTVQKICQLIDRQEGKVILVGHSKNGIMISQTAELRPEKIEKLIYLAAYLIPNGKTQAEYSAQDTEGVLKPYVTRFPETGSHTLQPEIYREGLYHDCPEYITQLANVLLGHEPVESGITPLQLSEERFGSVPRYYTSSARKTGRSRLLSSKKCIPKRPAKKFIKWQRATRRFSAGRRSWWGFFVR
jgi:pimeloyl-ACP methyl ester carboxylesterase